MKTGRWYDDFISLFACLQSVVLKLARPEVKDTLRRNTERAIAEGLFGVPTLTVDDQHFWGFDMTDAAIAYLGGDPIVHSQLMTRAGALPEGVTRVPR